MTAAPRAPRKHVRGTGPGPRSPDRRRFVAATLAAAALLVSACGDDGGAAGATPAGSSTTAPPTSTTAAAPTTSRPPVTTPTTTTTTGGTGAGGPTATTGPTPVRLVAIGDSYSAGVGATTKEVDVDRSCSRDPAASIGTLTAAALRARGISVELDLRACSGGTVAQVVQQADGVRGADAISVTFGGNDFGFSRVIGDCVLRGCKSYDQPGDHLPGLPHDAAQDDWQVLQQRLVDGLLSLRDHLSPSGRVYVLTYPIPFPADPDPTCLQNTAPFSESSRILVNAATEKLDRTIADAAIAANAQAGVAFVDVVEWRTGLDRPLRTITDAAVTRQVRDNPNGICAPEPFVNGVALAGSIGDSFHPTDRGHAFAGEAVARAIAQRRTS